MLITMLRGRKAATTTLGATRGRSRTRSTVIDISGPLQVRASQVASGPALPYIQTPQAAAKLRAEARQRGPTELSNLPRELDPFERDWPWGGQPGAEQEAPAGSTERSPTFERDLQRVLQMFAA